MFNVTKFRWYMYVDYSIISVNLPTVFSFFLFKKKSCSFYYSLHLSSYYNLLFLFGDYMIKTVVRKSICATTERQSSLFFFSTWTEIDRGCTCSFLNRLWRKHTNWPQSAESGEHPPTWCSRRGPCSAITCSFQIRAPLETARETTWLLHVDRTIRKRSLSVKSS